jgi:two-component system KDP operon response regulator KdpE
MNAAPIKVLVIDDEPPIRKLLRMGLSTQGYDILEASNGKIALEMLAEGPALIILDLGLPDIQGHELLRMIRGRTESVPIVVLSSRGDEAGKVQALDLGADDYLTKPFGMDELLARMRAALRHQLQVQGERPVFRTSDLSVDLVRRIVKVGEREVKLSPKEYELLRVLVQHAGKVLTHRFLLKELWDELTDAQYLRVYVRQLRQKIEADPERPQFVLTETGSARLRAPGLMCAQPFEARRGLLERCAAPMVKISDLLAPTDVMIDVRTLQKRLLMQELAARTAAGLGLPADQVASYLIKREDLGSTGIGRGVAIPHARLPDLQRPHGLLAKLKQPVDFDAIDGQAVDLVFVLLLPAAAEHEALGALALVARTLRSADNLARLRGAKNASELYSAIA